MGFVQRHREPAAEQADSGQLHPDLPAYATGTVFLDTVGDDGTVVHHHQTFEAGRLVEWEQDDHPGPWALVRHGDPHQPCPAGVASPEQVAAVRVRLGERLTPLPMLDDLPSPGFDRLPRIPDATARLRFEVTGSPVGVQRADVRYQDGRRTAWLVREWGDTAEGEPAHGAPEMAVSMTFRNYLLMRSGRLTALEALEDGGVVDARWTLLLLLHGLVQSPEYVEAYRELPVLPDELGWWGLVAPWIGAA